jgi:hypothetical protein
MADMKELTEMMKGLIAEVKSVKEELASLKTGKTPEKTEKPVKEKEDKSFAGRFGKFLVNEDGTGKTIKHVAELTDGDEDEWFGVWDIKNKTFNRKDTDETYESFGEFGTAHYKSLTGKIKKTLDYDSNGGWDKVKVYDVGKKKYLTASSLLPQGIKPRSQSTTRSSSSSKKTSEDGLAPIKTRSSGRRVSIKLSPRESEAASSAALSAAIPAAAAAAIKAHDEETIFFAFKDGNDKVFLVNSVNLLEDILGDLNLKQSNYFNKEKNKISLFQACCEFYKDNDALPLTEEDVDKVFQQQLDG